MAFRNLLSADRGAVRTLTVHRPDKLNALNRDTLNELAIAFEQARHDDAVRVVVLAGAGEKAFVAGADIAEFSTLSPVQAQAFSRAGQQLMRGIERFPKPVLARIQGFALGGGMELAMSCHLRVASERAKFGQPEINLGVIPGFGGTQRLLRRVGAAMALELCMRGNIIDAQEALRIGLCNKVLPAAELLAAAVATIEEIAAHGPLAVGAAKAIIHRGADLPLPDANLREVEAFAGLFATTDQREGMAAFLGKRKPAFTGC